jgi:large subunit ribosomal protein L13e
MHHIKPIIAKKFGKQRTGKGFSREELKKAGVNPQEAARLKLRSDRRRKTAHDENVQAIKSMVAKAKAEQKPKPKPKSELKKKAKS